MTQLPPIAALPTVGVLPAEVERVAGGLRVRSQYVGLVDARLALPGVRLCVGDSVLVALDPSGHAYVVGVLDASLRAQDGASARIDERGALQVRDPSGELVFEHHGGKGILHATSGSLELRAAGSIELNAGDRIKIKGEREVALESPRAVRLDTTDKQGRPRATLLMTRRAVKLVARVLGVSATASVLEGEDVRVRVSRIEAEGESMLSTYERLEVRADHLVERTKETYREVEKLAQTRAGRLRLIAKDTLHAFGKHTLLKAEEDVKIKGEKIYLS